MPWGPSLPPSHPWAHVPRPLSPPPVSGPCPLAQSPAPTVTATAPPQLLVWNHSSLSPAQQYTEHLAAVKAIAWSPHQHGLLASGGGTADRCIRFWNTLTGQPLQCIDTGSQVCNLAWSKHANELVSGEALRAGGWAVSRAGVPGMPHSPACPPPGQHARLLAEPDPGVEVPISHAGGQAHRALVPRPLPGEAAGGLGVSIRDGARIRGCTAEASAPIPLLSERDRVSSLGVSPGTQRVDLARGKEHGLRLGPGVLCVTRVFPPAGHVPRW